MRLTVSWLKWGSLKSEGLVTLIVFCLSTCSSINGTNRQIYCSTSGYAPKKSTFIAFFHWGNCCVAALLMALPLANSEPLGRRIDNTRILLLFELWLKLCPVHTFHWLFRFNGCCANISHISLCKGIGWIHQAEPGLDIWWVRGCWRLSLKCTLSHGGAHKFHLLI